MQYNKCLESFQILARLSILECHKEPVSGQEAQIGQLFKMADKVYTTYIYTNT